MFIDVLKRLAFLIIYFPALIYGCQYAYYLGITEPIKADIAEIGLSNYEVMFRGVLSFLTHFSDLIKIIYMKLKTPMLYIFLTSIYLVACYFCLFFGFHPLKRHKIKNFMTIRFANFKFYYSYLHKPIKDKISEYVFSIYFFMIALLIAWIFIVKSYNTGVTNLTKDIYSIYNQENKVLTGKVTEGKSKYDIYKIVCGSYKCIGLDIKNNKNVTFLPETYKQDFDLQTFKEKYKPN